MTQRRALHLLALAVVSPLTEKNPIKVSSSSAPVILSMSRLIVLAFAVAMVHQLWLAAGLGWPDATLSIAIVLALPMVNALDHARPAQVREVAKALIARFGVGDVARSGGQSTEPSKYDDHTNDRTVWRPLSLVEDP